MVHVMFFFFSLPCLVFEGMAHFGWPSQEPIQCFVWRLCDVSFIKRVLGQLLVKTVGPNNRESFLAIEECNVGFSDGKIVRADGGVSCYIGDDLPFLSLWTPLMRLQCLAPSRCAFEGTDSNGFSRHSPSTTANRALRRGGPSSLSA